MLTKKFLFRGYYYSHYAREASRAIRHKPRGLDMTTIQNVQKVNLKHADGSINHNVDLLEYSSCDPECRSSITIYCVSEQQQQEVVDMMLKADFIEINPLERNY